MADPMMTPSCLSDLQRQSFDYILNEVNLENGLVSDKTLEGSPASIAVVGLALTAYPVGVERALIARDEAVKRTLATLRFFSNSRQSTDPDATGYKGFYYHFLDMKTGRRVWNCELSTVDSAIFLAGTLAAAAYFAHETAEENEIRSLATELYQRADWQWAQNGKPTVTHGWKPESGFLPYRWEGYDEALFLYILGLASPTHPLSEESYPAWTSTYEWRRIYDHELLHSAPLFTHQISHIWIDFRGIQDAFMRQRSTDYFVNSRRATYVQREYAIRNPGQFKGYGKNCWGLTASAGPGQVTLLVEGRERRFFGYEARGVPDGPDDGTIAPFAVVASLPFAPEIVLPALHHLDELKLRVPNPYGYKSTFNASFPEKSGDNPFWVSPWHLGLNQGPIVTMIENYRSNLIWRLMCRCPYIANGLRKAGFAGGWLNEYDSTLK